MFGLFKKKDKFGDVKSYLERGAVILDVRTQMEFDEGHAKGSKHIQLDFLPDHLDEIRGWKKPIITCCRSGARSGNAEEFLADQGFDVINGGPWQNVDQYT